LYSDTEFNFSPNFLGGCGPASLQICGRAMYGNKSHRSYPNFVMAVLSRMGNRCLAVTHLILNFKMMGTDAVFGTQISV
jgi:hypothetical protein